MTDTRSAVTRGKGMWGKSRILLDKVIEITELIQPCSVRAIAYQLFNHKLSPSMGVRDTAMVSRLVLTARERGILPWEWIVDETREIQVVSTWSDLGVFGRTVQGAYRRDKWVAQPTHLELWSEKGTVAGTLKPVLDKFLIPFQILHGFGSATAIYKAAQAALDRDQPTTICYTGDWDPSGLCMSEQDLPSRIARYTTSEPNQDVPRDEVAQILEEADIEVQRIALTERDTAALGEAPSFPVSQKKKDPRHNWFSGNFGDRCWELDAMSPNDLRGRVEGVVNALIDWDSWREETATETEERAIVEASANEWAK